MAGALAGLALLASCAPEARTPVKVMVLVYDFSGSCVAACTSDSQCLRDQECTYGVCVAAGTHCSTDSQCPNGQKCESRNCVSALSACTNDAQCSPGQNCYGGHYVPQTVELTTPTDLVALQGPVARIVGGASFDLSDKNLSGVPANATLKQVLKAVTKDEGSGVRVSYLEKDGVLVPADFHSLNIATTYYNFERAFQFFQTVGGLTAEGFGTPLVYYFPTFVTESEPEKDNAAFASILEGFVILPFEQLQQVPMAINAGVVGHEYSHAVFNYRVFAKAVLPFPYSDWDAGTSSAPGLNLVRSLDEGTADIFGTGITCSKDLASCDATFFGESLPLDVLEERRLDGRHCMTGSLKALLAEAGASTFSDSGAAYQVGSVLAGALWRAAGDSEVATALTAGGARLAMYKTLFKALAGGADGKSGLRELILSARGNQALFRLDSAGGAEGVLNVIVRSATDATLKAALCRAFLDRFQLTVSEIPACAGQPPFKECS